MRHDPMARVGGDSLQGEARFHGLFIGIDYFESPAFRQLSYAKRDATSLCALFLDNFGENAKVVLDADATKDRVVTEVGQIASASSDDDIVVITYSGHGTPDRHVAARDTDPERPEETALSHDWLMAMITKIRARVLLVVLDCCYSGSAVSGVLVGEEGSNRSVATMPTEVTGEGRLVLAAAEHVAKEKLALGHGLLTYHLLKALLGEPSVRDGDRVSLLKLADYVVRSVAEHKPNPGQAAQTARMAGQAGNVVLPILRPGKRFRAVDEELTPIRVTSAFSSFEEHGIPAPLIDAWQARYRSLNALQVAAVNDGGLMLGANLLVSAPTAAGKTLVGEIAAMRAVAKGGRAVFLLPTRALVNEQYEQYSATYQAAGVRVIRVTGELRDQTPALLEGDFELAILTYEKYLGLLSSHEELLTRTQVLVIDEIQTLALPDRGPELELLLTWIRRRRLVGTAPQVIGMSGVLGEPAELAQWLGAELVQSAERPVPLVEGVVDPSGRYHHRDERGDEFTCQIIPATDSDTLTLELVRTVVAQGDQVIVFAAKRRDAVDFAETLGRELGLAPATEVLESLGRAGRGRLAEQLRRCLEGRVAFHISDLRDRERRVVEEAFRTRGSEIRVVVATTTLAQGINLAADVVVIRELDHPGPKGRAYSVAQYKNMAGRAGRTAGMRHGRTFVVANGPVDHERKWSGYVSAEPEPVRSSLADGDRDLRTTVLRAFAGPASVGVTTVNELAMFLSWTFAARLHTVGLTSEPFPRDDIVAAVDSLVRGGLVDRSDGTLSLTTLGSIAVRGGLSVDSVIAVAEALAAVPADELNRVTLISAAQLVAEIDDVRFTLPRNHWRKEWQALLCALRDQKIAEPMLTRLMNDPGPNSIGATRARRALACLRWSQGVGIDQIECDLTRHQWIDARSTGPIEQAARRSATIVGSVIDMARHIHPTADLGILPELLPAQLDLGIAQGLVPVARYIAVDFDRETYLALAREELDSAGAILDADPATVRTCVGQEHVDALLAAALQAREAMAGNTPPTFPQPVD